MYQNVRPVFRPNSLFLIIKIYLHVIKVPSPPQQTGFPQIYYNTILYYIVKGGYYKIYSKAK